MSVKQKRRLLWGATLLLVVASAGVITYPLRQPVRPPEPPKPRASPAPAQEITGEAPAIKLESFENHWSRRLQRPLYDPPPEEAEAEPEPEPEPEPLALELIGTMIEIGNAQAALMNDSGEMHFARVGETIGEAEVRAIEEGRVDLAYHGRNVTLRVDDDE